MFFFGGLSCFLCSQSRLRNKEPKCFLLLKMMFYLCPCHGDKERCSQVGLPCFGRFASGVPRYGPAVQEGRRRDLAQTD